MDNKEIIERLGKLSTLLLEGFIEKHLGEKFVEELGKPTEISIEVAKALDYAEKRFAVEFVNPDLIHALFVDLTQEDRTAIIEAAGDLFDHLNILGFREILFDRISGDIEGSSRKEFEKGIHTYLLILIEELALENIEFREKISKSEQFRKQVKTLGQKKLIERGKYFWDKYVIDLLKELGVEDKLGRGLVIAVPVTYLFFVTVLPGLSDENPTKTIRIITCIALLVWIPSLFHTALRVWTRKGEHPFWTNVFPIGIAIVLFIFLSGAWLSSGRVKSWCCNQTPTPSPSPFPTNKQVPSETEETVLEEEALVIETTTAEEETITPEGTVTIINKRACLSAKDTGWRDFGITGVRGTEVPETDRHEIYTGCFDFEENGFAAQFEETTGEAFLKISCGSSSIPCGESGLYRGILTPIETGTYTFDVSIDEIGFYNYTEKEGELNDVDLYIGIGDPIYGPGKFVFFRIFDIQEPMHICVINNVEITCPDNVKRPKDSFGPEIKVELIVNDDVQIKINDNPFGGYLETVDTSYGTGIGNRKLWIGFGFKFSGFITATIKFPEDLEYLLVEEVEEPATATTASISSPSSPYEEINNLISLLRSEIENTDPGDDGRLSFARETLHTYDYRILNDHEAVTTGLWDYYLPASAIWGANDISSVTKGVKNNQSYWEAFLKVEWTGSGTKADQTWKVCVLEEDEIWLIDLWVKEPEGQCEESVNRLSPN